MEEKEPCCLRAPRTGFLPPKPLMSLACPRGAPFPNKRGTKAPRQREVKKEGMTRVGFGVEREVISPGQDLLFFYLQPVHCWVYP